MNDPYALARKLMAEEGFAPDGIFVDTKTAITNWLQHRAYDTRDPKYTAALSAIREGEKGCSGESIPPREETVAALQGRITTLTLERDDARRTIIDQLAREAETQRRHDKRRDEMQACIDSVTAERNEARAEVKRLRAAMSPLAHEAHMQGRIYSEGDEKDKHVWDKLNRVVEQALTPPTAEKAAE